MKKNKLKKSLSILIPLFVFFGALFFLMPQRAQIVSDKSLRITDEVKRGDPSSVIANGVAEAKRGTVQSHRARSKTSSQIPVTPPNIEEQEENVHPSRYAYDNEPGDAAAPTNAPSSPNGSLLSGDGGPFAAPGDMQYFRSHDMTASEAPNRSVISEPSVVNVGSGVFYTANWYAARSLDAGQSFSYVNPYSTFPSVNGGFCCDQVTAFAPNQDMILWGLQYLHDNSTSTFRIARTIGTAGLSSGQWTYWNFTPQNFGLSSGLWLDFPDMSVSGSNLYITSNIYTVSGGIFFGSVVWRIPLVELAAGGAINYTYVTYTNPVGSLRLTEGAGNTMHWVTTVYSGMQPSIRIYDWADASNMVTSRDVAVSNFNPLNRDGVATSPDGTNWAAHVDSRILAAYVANGVVGAMWSAKQGGSFPYPYTIHARFNEASGALISENPVWNPGFAWLYPTASVNAAGNIGGAIAYGGGAYYPDAAIWALDDIENTLPLGGIYAALIGTNGPSANVWGDYLSVKPHKQYANTWVAAIYCLSGGQGDANAVSRYLWFGRQRNGPNAVTSVPFDYDGDAKSDISVFRPSTGAWYLQRSQAGFLGLQFGVSADRITPADYDGDGKTDIAVYRPSTGVWYVFNSSNGTVTYYVFGISQDLPTPADYDGDGRADVSVFRPSTATWYRRNSSDGSFYGVQFGASGDKPTVGDFDGDGKADIAVFRPSNGVWYRINSSNGSFFGEQFGIATDLIVPADYDGDGKADLAVYRSSNGFWYVKQSLNSIYTAFQFGLPTDLPAIGDYDGDGKADLSVFRPANGTWYRMNSSDGSFFSYPFGTNGDKPTQTAFRY